MQELVEQYQLTEKSLGVVLAVNARVLAKRVGCFDELLKAFPFCQLLIWTGTGEPAISSFLLQYLKDHFESIGSGDRVGFDCQVSQSRRTMEFRVQANCDFERITQIVMFIVQIRSNRIP
jgi:hypothetical protein